MEYQELSELSATPDWRIWRGENPQRQERRTIKELTDATRGNEAHRRRLAAEAQFLSGLAHHRFLAVHETLPHTLIMDDVQGTLQQLVQQSGPLPSDLIANVMAECVEGLEYLHGRGFGHGMLSAENLFVNGRGEIQFADFLGYRFNSEKPVSDRGRKLRYRAPEVLDSNFGECGPWSDLYCLGYLAIELAAGSEFASLFGIAPPQPGQNPKWLSWHVNPELSLTNWMERVPQLATGLAEVINALILKDAARRQFRTVNQLDVKLRSLGQRSRRVLPMFNRVEQAPVKKDFAAFRAPSRVIGPTLWLRRAETAEKPVKFSPEQQVLVSRDEGTSLAIPHDETVGKRHALLACQTADWHVYDLYCHGGTYLNGTRVTRPAKLKAGDELRFGKTDYLVDLELAGTGIIPGFDLLERIHAGAGGDVYRAAFYRNSTKSKLSALRLFPANFAIDLEQVRRFLRAVPAAGKLRHPNIVRLHRGGMIRRAEAQWYLATEYMPRGSLSDRIRRRGGPLSLSETLRMAHDVGQALSAAHGRGLIHRNINSSCILFDKRGTAKLGDFTLMRGEVLETMYEITRGKLQNVDFEFQAPEILLGSETYTPACDLFSLSVCVFLALTGRLPYAPQESMAANVVAISQMEWPSPCQFNPEVPIEWEEFLRIGLARDPERRFASTDEFLEQLARLVPA